MPSRVSAETTRKSKQTKCRPGGPELDSFEETSVMTSPASDIKAEIQELIDLQIRVFGQRAPLTVLDLEDCRCRIERIKWLGRKLDEIGIAESSREGSAEGQRQSGGGQGSRFVAAIKR